MNKIVALVAVLANAVNGGIPLAAPVGVAPVGVATSYSSRVDFPSGLKVGPVAHPVASPFAPPLVIKTPLAAPAVVAAPFSAPAVLKTSLASPAVFPSPYSSPFINRNAFIAPPYVNSHLTVPALYG